MDLLSALGKLPISLEILTKTRIGFTVNALRKSIRDDEATSALAKELIKRWKKLIDNRDAGGSNGSQAVTASSVKTPAAASSSVPKSASSASLSTRKSEVSRATSIPADSSSDGIRSKCREMLAAALSTPFPDSFSQNDDIDFGELGDAGKVAERIEHAIYNEFKNVDNRYKNRVRSRVANLKDNRNPDLRLNVLKGIIKPDRIATMDAVVSF